VALPKISIECLRNQKKFIAEQKLKLGTDYQNNDLVFHDADGSLLNPDRLTKGFEALMIKSDIPKKRFHDLRHSHASQLLNKNINVINE